MSYPAIDPTYKIDFEDIPKITTTQLAGWPNLQSLSLNGQDVEVYSLPQFWSGDQRYPTVNEVEYSCYCLDYMSTAGFGAKFHGLVIGDGDYLIVIEKIQGVDVFINSVTQAADLVPVFYDTRFNPYKVTLSELPKSIDQSVLDAASQLWQLIKEKNIWPINFVVRVSSSRLALMLHTFHNGGSYTYLQTPYASLIEMISEKVS